MADFDLNSFVSNPTIEQLNAFRKDDLICVAEYFQIRVNRQQLKREIKSAVVKGLEELGVMALADGIEQDSLSADAYPLVFGEEDASETAEVEESKAKAVLPPFDPFSPALSGSGGEARLKLRLAKIQMEERMRVGERRAELELELEIRRLEIDADKQIKLRELELRVARDAPGPPVPIAPAPLQINPPLPVVQSAPAVGADAVPRVGASGSTFEVSKHIARVPQFREIEVDSYFNVFERIASALNWPRDVWTLLLQCKLTGKAQEVCAVLSLEDSLNYDVVKTAILRAYELVPEAYRQRFRNYKKNLSQTFVEFAREKSMLFDKWCVASKVTDFQALREFILLEEFKGCISDRIAVYINEQKVSSLSNASVLADEFTLTHKTVFIARTEKVPSNSSASKDQTRFKSIGTKGREERQCFYCHKSVHVIADCFTLKRKQQINPPKNVAFVRTVDEIEKENHDEIDVGYQPFLMEGLVSADAQSTDQVKVTMLHDTGAMQTMVAEDAFFLF